MKSILWIATGGTIASVETDRGLAPGLGAEELLKFVPEIRTICRVEARQICNLDSTDIGLEEWKAMTAVLEEEYDRFDGFVISHGTDTMAYTAAVLSYMIQNVQKPIVLTGSQLPPGSPDSDARQNLKDAFLYASDGMARGVSVVFGGKAIDGRRAKKLRSKSLDAFASINAPELAKIQDGNVIWASSPENKKPAIMEEGPVFFYDMRPECCVLKLTPNLSTDLFRGILKKVPGVVLESFGLGGIPACLRRCLCEEMQNRDKKGFVTVLTTQVLFEGSDMSVYEVGREILQKTSVMDCGDMTTEAALAKTMWLLGQKN